MAKKLVYNYTFDASEKTIQISGLHKLRTLQMITNVTDNIIIYNFADASKGGSVSYNSTTDVTTLTLSYNTTSMSDSDELQIFIDEQEQQMDVSESLIDPVHKFRVSTPENLIDTDFEYGLQPTKWETVELVNNIPSVYVKSPGVSIGLIEQVNGQVGSNSITVTCGVAHELSIGDPIEVQGTSSRTANGKFIINAVPSTTSFVYKAKGVQSSTGNYKTAYTTIIPGAFFTGSNVEFNATEGVNTNNQDPSTLTITTNYHHGLSTSTSLYITNTVGKKSISIAQTSATAPDGSPYVNDTNDTLYMPLHGLYTDQTIYLSAGSGGILPGTSSAPPAPSDATTIKAVYNSVKTACDSIRTTMGTDASRIYMNSGDNSFFAWYAVNSVFITPYTGGDSEIQFLTYGEYPNSSNNYDYIYFYTASGFYTSDYVWYPYGEGNLTLFTGNSVDLGQYFFRNNFNTSNAGGVVPPASLANLGFNYISTPYQTNQFTPYIISIRQYPRSNVVSPTNAFKFAYLNTNSSYTTSYGYSTPVNYNLNRQTKSGGWQYAWVSTYAYYTYNGTGYLKYTIYLENTNWDGQYGSGALNANWSYVYGASLKHYFNSYTGTNYHIEVLLPLDKDTTFGRYGPTGSVRTDQQIVNIIVDQIIADLTPTPLTVGINTLRASVIDNNRIKLKNSSGIIVDFTNKGKAPLLIETAQTFGIADDYYNITGVTSTTVSIASSSRLASRELTFSNTDVISANSNYYLRFVDGHGIKGGQKVVYDLVSGSTIAGITSGSTYYTIPVNDKYLQLANTPENVLSGINSITGLPASTGSYKLTVPSISGRVSAAGTVTTSESSNTVTGTNTRFSSTYSVGDPFIVVGLGTYAPYIENQVASVVSDTSITLANNAGITTIAVNHFIDTKIYTRSDGTFLHRPFDGGVDITAGTSPDSKIIRQTRKYFRYQSGKGIQCSLAINFNPYRQIRLLEASGTTVTATTEYPHGLSVGNSIKIRNGSSNYNGTFTLTAVDTFTFTYTALSAPAVSPSTGFCEYTINGYQNAVIRAGLFDDQNGFFYEYNGQNLYCVRRSSTQQLTGTMSATYKSNKILGSNTRFADQLTVGDMIVVRGQSYKVTRINGQDEIDIQPKYRGSSNSGIVITLTEDTKVIQSSWSIDKADGTGPSGYILDINSIQMAYMDYSWYGAGKIRFGFKDTYGKVKYMHEFIHNNRRNEAYMRTGNVPARYEVANIGTPTFVPSLFHWGTSVIMDGGFDNDDSYLFTASGKALSFTNGDSDTAATNANSTLSSTRLPNNQRDYYLQLSFATNVASKFTSGAKLYTSDGQLNGRTVTYTQYSGSNFLVFVYLSTGFVPPAIYPSITSGTTVSVGAPASGTDNVDLTDLIPLISIRLAPAVDNNLIGSLGERDIINRMQLKLQEMGISVSHDSKISVILNGSLSDLDYSNVGSPSLSQYISHSSGDTIQNGTTIYQFRASGGSIGTSGQRTVASETFDLSRLGDLGNSVLGGDGVFPNGPDIITICASVLDTAGINKTSPYQVSSRISWSESQA